MPPGHCPHFNLSRYNYKNLQHQSPLFGEDTEEPVVGITPVFSCPSPKSLLGSRLILRRDSKLSKPDRLILLTSIGRDCVMGTRVQV